MKVTSGMVQTARHVLGDDVPEETVRLALEAALTAAPVGKGARPSPALLARIVTTRVPAGNKVAIPKAVVWSRKPRPKR